jgi:hypothetical protein
MKMHEIRRFNKVIGMIALAALLLAAVPAAKVNAQGNTLDVCPSGCSFNTIEAAITAANNGDSIQVAGGTYDLAGTSITKDLTIIGENKETTIIKSTGSISDDYKNIWIQVDSGSSFELSNLTLDGDTQDLNRGISGSNLSIDNVIFKSIDIPANFDAVIWMQGSGTLTVSNSTFNGVPSQRPAIRLNSDGELTAVLTGNNFDQPLALEMNERRGDIEINAEMNWWGNVTGPDEGQISILAGDPTIDYEPWCTDESCSLGPDTVWVDDDFTSATPGWGVDHFSAIQGAVDAAGDGAQINILPGSYPVADTIMLDKPLTLMGPDGDVAEVVGVGGETVKVFEITSGDVTIQNLSITLGTQPANHDGMISIPDNAIANIFITNNKIYVGQQPGEMSTWWARAIQVGRYVTNLVVSGNEMYNTRSGLVINYNSSAVISDNVIYNTKGGIMNYTGSVEDYQNRLIQNNSWNGVHNEWDIVWNSGGGPYEQDYSESVLGISQANNDAYVTSLMTVTETKTTLGGNRSHVFVDPNGVTEKNWSDGNMNVPFATFELAMDAVVEGGTVFVAPGTYAENVVVDKQVSIIGSGSEAGTGTTVTTPASFDNKEGVFQITGSGVSGSPILLQDLRIEPVGQAGISVGRFTEATATNVSDLTLENVHVIGTNTNPSTEQERGLYVDLSSTLDNLTINNSAFDNLTYGWYFQKEVSADASTVSNVQVNNTSFNHNNHKGIYAEKLEDATFTGIDVRENGYDSSILPSYFMAWSAGIDFNLKAGTYQNISIVDSSIMDNAADEAKEGAGLMIKARDDGATYGAFPAELSGVLVQGCTISGNERGVRIGEPGKDNAGPTDVTLENNQILGNVQNYSGSDGSAYGDVINVSQAGGDASPNWWGSFTGPKDSQIEGDIAISPWCGDEACSFTVPDENGVITLSGNVNVPGGIVVNQPGLTFLLENGTVIQNNSPCFVINADYTKILTESPLGAACLPTAGANGIDVAENLTNVLIEGLEINGSDGTDGIHFDGAVTDLVVRDNFIHDAGGDGLFFAAPPAGTVDIQGNLFVDNAGLGLNNAGGTSDLLAEYNAWGSYDGPAAGDGISAFVDADPWTHVDLFLESSGTMYTNRVVQGETITYQVKGNLANVMAADVVLDYPAELSVDSLSPGGKFEYETLTDESGQLHFMGYQFGSKAVSEEDAVLFTVTFNGDTLGKSLVLDLVDTPDSFGMAPGTGPSNTVYAAALDDVENLEVITLPTLSSADIVGPYVAGIQQEFQVTLENPASGGEFDHVRVNFRIKDTDLSDIDSLQFFNAGTSTWDEITNLQQDGADVFGYFGPSAGFPLTAPYSETSDLRVIFMTPGLYDFEAELVDVDTGWVLTSFSEDDIVVNGDFDVTGTVSMQGRSVRSDVPLALTTLSEPDFGVFNAMSIDLISNNYTFSGVNGGDYEFTTNQPRYLNVTADLDKQFNVASGSVWLEALELVGGNANWGDNIIDVGDAGIVAGQYQQPTFDDGDVNFDGRVNIQDLALVGGNYHLTSAGVYADWEPLVP